jgi:hypothetical protein
MRRDPVFRRFITTEQRRSAPRSNRLRLTGNKQATACPGPVVTVLLAAAVILSLIGCGASGKASSQGSLGSSEPSYASEPLTPEQQLVEQGARLVVSDGCSVCHLAATGRSIAPSFASFAGHRVMLADGRRIFIDERFVREALSHLGKTQIKGYDPTLMIAATKRLNLADHPQQVAALAAFIEQIGPEPG